LKQDFRVALDNQEQSH
jgi:hypothetical protein